MDSISRTPMPHLHPNLDEEDEYSHRIGTEDDVLINRIGTEDEYSHRFGTEDDVLITEVEKATNGDERLKRKRATFREDSKEETDEEFVTHELFEDESNNNKTVESKGSKKIINI